MKKNLNAEINVREKKHREEMLNLDRNLEGKSTEEAVGILDGIEERAQELLECIDRKLGRYDRELEDIDKESNERDWVAIGLLAITFGFSGIVVVLLIMGLMGWMT